MNSHIPDEKKQETDEHILVCLSSHLHPMKKLSATAAKDGPCLPGTLYSAYMYRMESDRNTLIRRDWIKHIRFAEKMGAEIVMTHGENVPVQIAEYAQLSSVTTIVIGQSNVRQNHIFSRQTLTEKLIDH